MNAEVTMPLSEIDNLRDNLKNALARIKELESTEKKIKVEIRELRLDYEIFPTGYTQSKVIKTPNWKEYPHQYINLDEVISTIRQEEQFKVDANTRKLEKTVRDLVDQHGKLEIKNSEKIKKLKEKYETEIKILKDQKVDRSKEEVIINNEKTINKLRTQNYILDGFADQVINSKIGRILFKQQINKLNGQKKTTV